MLEVSLGIDVEPDCPPYLATQYRGVVEGLPRILDALDSARFPASITSSAVRLPRVLRESWLATLSSAVVLFVHPWEFVDLTRERLRLDCRFRTGEPALRAVMEVVAFFRTRGARFVRMSEI